MGGAQMQLLLLGMQRCNLSYLLGCGRVRDSVKGSQQHCCKTARSLILKVTNKYWSCHMSVFITVLPMLSLMTTIGGMAINANDPEPKDAHSILLTHMKMVPNICSRPSKENRHWNSQAMEPILFEYSFQDHKYRMLYAE